MQGVCGLIMYENRKMGVLMEYHRKGEMCGAVSGALMVLGLLYGHSESDDLETKARSYTMAEEYMNRFKARNGSVVCRELLEEYNEEL